MLGRKSLFHAICYSTLKKLDQRNNGRQKKNLPFLESFSGGRAKRDKLNSFLPSGLGKGVWGGCSIRHISTGLRLRKTPPTSAYLHRIHPLALYVHWCAVEVKLGAGVSGGRESDAQAWWQVWTQQYQIPPLQFSSWVGTDKSRGFPLPLSISQSID